MIGAEPNEDKINKTAGTLYGVGVGPGDPELLTLKAVRVLDSADVIAMPRSAESGSGESVALSIVEGAVSLEGKELLEVPMTMTRDPARLAESRASAAQLIAARLGPGRTVAFVTLGDPMLYSTFTYLVPLVQAMAPGVRIASVAGVTSVSAVASAACTPLAESNERVVIIPAAYDIGEIERALDAYDTVVLMKVNRKIDEIVDLIEARGLAENTVFTSRVGMPGSETVTSDIGRLKGTKVDYFSTIIVRKGPGMAARTREAAGV